MLAQPAAIPPDDPRSALAPALSLVRDAMMAHPDMVGGARDRLDTSLMKASPGRLLSKSGQEGLRGVAILPGPRGSGPKHLASGLAVKIEDGGGDRRAGWAATVEALRQVGVLDAAALRALGRYHRPGTRDSDGRVASEAIPGFDLVPVGELVP
jgi:L-asparaginase II